jgi:hypothetical protein
MTKARPNSEPEYEVVWPLSKSRVEQVGTAEAPAGLDNQRVAFIWDYRFRGDKMWQIIKEDLRALYPSVEFVGYEEFGDIHGEGEAELVAALPEKLRAAEIRAAIVGVGA